MQRLVGLLGLKGVGKDTAAKLLEKHFGFIHTSFAAELYQEIACAYDVSVAFLANRETKETPLKELKLSRCHNNDFVTVALKGIRDARANSTDESHSFPVRRSPRQSRSKDVHGRLVGGPSVDTLAELLAPRSPRWVLQQWGTEFRRDSAFGHPAYWVDRGRDFVDGHPGRDVCFADVRLLNETQFIRSRGGILIRIRREDIEIREQEARARGEGRALHSSETELKDFSADAEIENVLGHHDAMLGSLQAIMAKADLAA